MRTALTGKAMEYNRYFWKSGRNQRKRNQEEKKNLRKILFAFLGMMLAGILTGAIIVLIVHSA